MGSSPSPVPSQDAVSPRRVATRAASFVGLTLVASWTPWLVLVATTGDHSAGAGSMALFLAGGTAPTLTAVAAAALVDGRRGLRTLVAGLRRWRLGRWYALLVVPLPIGIVAVLAAVALGPAALDPAALGHWLLFPAFLLSGVLIGGLEEVGWRGYLQPVLQARWSAIVTSLVVAAIWSLWHAPLFWVGSTSQAETSPAVFVVQAVALSVIFAWAYNATGGSTLLAVLLHGALNGWYSLVIVGLAPDVGGGFTIGTAILTVVLALILLVRYGPRELADRPRTVWPEPSVPTGTERRPA